MKRIDIAITGFTKSEEQFIRGALGSAIKRTMKALHTRELLLKSAKLRAKRLTKKKKNG